MCTAHYCCYIFRCCQGYSLCVRLCFTYTPDKAYLPSLLNPFGGNAPAAPHSVLDSIFVLIHAYLSLGILCCLFILIILFFFPFIAICAALVLSRCLYSHYFHGPLSFSFSSLLTFLSGSPLFFPLCLRVSARIFPCFFPSYPEMDFILICIFLFGRASLVLLSLCLCLTSASFFWSVIILWHDSAPPFICCR